LPFLLTLGAQAKKIQLLMGYLIAGLPGYFLRNPFRGPQLWIQDLAAFGANEMGVRVGFIAIVMAPHVGKGNFQDLAHILQQA
jgi:hypothetical protein